MITNGISICTIENIQKIYWDGLTAYGGAQIDDNGILSNVNSKGKCAVSTELTTSIFNQPNEFQIKFRVPKPGDASAYLATTNFAGYPEFEISFKFVDSIFTIIRTHWNTNGTVYQQKISEVQYKNVGQWLYITYKDDGSNTKLVVKENRKMIFEEDFASIRCPYGNQFLVFGHDVDYTLPNAADIQIDLAETFIRNDEGEIISTWNL